jgi:hypothetical protein
MGQNRTTGRLLIFCRSRLVGSPHRREGGLEFYIVLDDVFAGKPGSYRGCRFPQNISTQMIV